MTEITTGATTNARARTTATAGPSTSLRFAQDDKLFVIWGKDKGKGRSFASLRMINSLDWLKRNTKGTARATATTGGDW
jgi:hypothetical protein